MTLPWTTDDSFGGLNVDRLMQAAWSARSKRAHPLTDEEWERLKVNPTHRTTLRAVYDDLVQQAEDGEFD